jgi:prepilin-type N-terminal cleavage/methylation domain-containing protein
MNSNNKGFTFLEILVALAIMSIGFLAMSQMQYLSLRQTNLSQVGAKSINLLQSIADRDMQTTRIIHLMNSRVYLDAQSGKTIINQDDYCDGTPPTDCLKPPCTDPCTVCPCNPLTVYTTDTTANNTETTCAFLSTVEFDPANIEYETNKTQCTNPACITANPPCTLELYLVRRVVTTVNQLSNPQEINLLLLRV